MFTIINPALLISAGRRSNSDTGQSFNLVYKGTESQIVATRAYYESFTTEPLGYSFTTDTIRIPGQGTVLTVIIPDNILFTDRWDLETETHPQPIWHVKEVRDLLSPNLTVVAEIEKAVAKARYKIEALVMARASLGVDSATTVDNTFESMYTSLAAEPNGANLLRVFRIMIRAGDYADIQRPILIRRRCIPAWEGTFTSAAGLTATRVRLTGRQEIYTTPKLIDTFDVPDSTIAQIETVENGLTEAPEDYLWSWKLDKITSATLIGSGKAEESQHWAFDLYSKITHTVIE